MTQPSRHTSPYVYPGTVLPPGMASRINAIVCEYFQVSIAQVCSTSRRSDAVRARHVCWVLMRRFCPELSLLEIGQVTGAVSHTTVVKALDKLSRRLEEDDAFEKKIEYLARQIQNIRTIQSPS